LGAKIDFLADFNSFKLHICLKKLPFADPNFNLMIKKISNLLIFAYFFYRLYNLIIGEERR